MKTIAITSPLITSSEMESSIMGMDAAGMNTATYFMRDKIYSNKIKAVVREYACNAIDEHQKHKVASEVEIKLLKQENKACEFTFSVRDFGKGLSESNVRNVFGMYFRSTKSTSNNSIGGFGVGSKAGHCYTDTFFVASHFKGVKSTYTCMLGGGDTGVPIGHIYKIDEQPTNESGIEISLTVQKSDYNAFYQEICNFIDFSNAKIAFHSDHETLRPNKIVWQKKISHYNFRLFEKSSINLNEVILQMGGVSYQKFNTANYVKKNHVLVIDIPIGMMSIPISRESFENTVSNEKVIKEITSLIYSLAEEDLNRFKDKDLVELIKDFNSFNYGAEYVGDIFSTNASNLYGDDWKIASKVWQSNKSSNQPVVFEESKPVLILMPNNNASDYWGSKIRNYSSEKNVNYYCIDEVFFYKNQSLISEFFHAKSVRKIKFDKNGKTNIFSVWSQYSKIGNHSALSLHNYANKTSYDTEEEAKKANLEFIKSIENVPQLMQITIGDSSCAGKSSYCSYYASSKQLLKSLVDLGWLVFNSKEYNEIYSKIRKKESDLQEHQFKIKNAKKHWVKLNERTALNVSKNSKHAIKLSDFWKKILNEDSTRGKIIQAIENANSYRYLSSFSREELRNILKLK
jgi:hypothetical protein